MTMENPNLSVLSAKAPDRVFMFTVGGCGEFGMNLTVYAYRGQIIIVDCGLAFAETFEIGIDAHIPSPQVLKEVLGAQPLAYLITHGHEDHLGALPFFLATWKAPVYLGPWARELLRDKLMQRGDTSSYEIHEVRPGDTTVLGALRVEWIHVPHSIPHCSSLCIEAGPHRIVHTGDFKTNGYAPFDLSLEAKTLEAIGRKGPVLALVADSTNAATPGFCPTEAVVLPELGAVIKEAKGVTFITTFSSNLWRIKSVLLLAKEQSKRVFVLGAGMRKSIELGVKFRLLSDEVNVLVDEAGLKSLQRRELLVLCSGCQGEYRSGLRRLVGDEVNALKIMADDQVVFSSRVIPGNEKSIAKMVSICHQKGALVITSRERPQIHVSGHAYAEDLGLFLKHLKPRYHIPVHGTFTQLRANQLLAAPEERVSVTNGSIISLRAEGCEKVAEVALERLFVDSWSRQTMSYDVMRERHKIGDSGLAVVTGFIDSKRVEFDIEFVGLPFQDEGDEKRFLNVLLGRMRDLYKRLEPVPGGLSSEYFNEQTRLLIRRALSDRFMKKPVVMSKIFLATEH